MNEPSKRCGILFCVSGPSGVGKGTIIQEIRRLRPEMTHSVSITTRLPRPGEIEGVHYYFRTHAEFDRLVVEGEILEHDGYCGNYYGTPATPLHEMLNQGLDVLMDITVPGSLAIMNHFPDAVSIFLMPPSFTELRRRLKQRGTEQDQIVEARMQNSRDEIGKANLFNYLVVNDNLDQAIERILAIVQAEHCRYSRIAGIEDQILAL
jgi:guanylate kinase